MGYTKTLRGKSKLVLITATAQSLADLIAEAVEEDANRVEISFIQDITTTAPIAFITEDLDHTLVVDDGDAIYAGARITVTKENFTKFKILKAGGADFNMWLKQLDHEQERT